MDRLFIYGSLQPGGDNEHVLAGLEGDWETASVRGRLLEAGWGANLGYPGVVLDEAAPPVQGFLFSSAQLESFWPELDHFEGGEYERCQVEVSLPSGATVTAHIYALRAGDIRP